MLLFFVLFDSGFGVIPCISGVSGVSGFTGLESMRLPLTGTSRNGGGTTTHHSLSVTFSNSASAGVNNLASVAGTQILSTIPTSTTNSNNNQYTSNHHPLLHFGGGNVSGSATSSRQQHQQQATDNLTNAIQGLNLSNFGGNFHTASSTGSSGAGEQLFHRSYSDASANNVDSQTSRLLQQHHQQQQQSSHAYLGYSTLYFQSYQNRFQMQHQQQLHQRQLQQQYQRSRMSNEFGIGIDVGATSSSHPHSTTIGGMTGRTRSAMSGMESSMSSITSMSDMGATQMQMAPIHMQMQVPMSQQVSNMTLSRYNQLSQFGNSVHLMELHNVLMDVIHFQCVVNVKMDFRIVYWYTML